MPYTRHSIAEKSTMERAAKHLVEKDPILASVIREVGIIDQKLSEDYFFSIVESILSQQLTPKAADSIIRRFVSLFDGGEVKAEVVGSLEDEQLRSCGISRQKISYIRSLSENFVNGNVSAEKLPEMDDEEIIDKLIEIRGVGRWTAKMILIFTLGRPDVLPHEDLGIINAIRKLYSLEKKPAKGEIEKIAESWHPYCSVASLYLWKLKDELPWDKQY